MKDVVKYGYLTLVVVQILFIILWKVNLNILGVVSWIGEGESYSFFKLFLPAIIYGSIKILYWFADPIAELFDIILRWVMIFGVCYLFYWLFII